MSPYHPDDTGARETHWHIAITQPVVDDVVTTHVECGCGWTNDYPDSTARTITKARDDWWDHDCEGRPWEDKP